MIVPTHVFAPADALKGIHLELALKGRELRLTKEAWHDIRGKGILLVNDEPSAMRHPRDYVSIALGVQRIEHHV
jgi:hypothetical protein